MANSRKKSSKKPPTDTTTFDGLSQTFYDKKGDEIMLSDVLSKEDSWELKKNKTRMVILTHAAIKKIARIAGLKVIGYDIKTQPDVRNNYQYTIQATIESLSGDRYIALGEANRNNLGSRGKNNPANMAEKRAFDRAVFECLGIHGLLSEDQLIDDDEQMDTLTHDEQLAIAPYINDILLAKNKMDLTPFVKKMQTAKATLPEKAVDYLRKLFQKKLAELSKSF